MGGGPVAESSRRDHLLLVSEPEVHARLHVTRLFNLKFGAGDRFVRNAGDLNGKLGGLTGTLGLGLSLFGN